MIEAFGLRMALRNLKKDKVYAIINIAGLVAATTAFLLIIAYVKYERSYDSFHSKSEKIYRLRYERASAEGESVKFASCCPPAAIRIRELYPDVEAVGRLFRYRATVIFGDRTFYEEKMYFAEPQIFNVFDVEMVAGNKLTGIKDANCAFISTSYARKYFGDTDPLGKTITVDKEMSFVITGIFKDLPENSHIDIGLMLSWPDLVTHYGPDIEESWGDTGFYTYLVLKPSASPAEFEAKLKDLVESEFGDVLRHYKLTLDLKLQPLKEIHLNSHYMQEIKANGNKDTVLFLTVIAFVILAVAWVNYINITTARSLTRAKEVGLCKVTGASRYQLIIRFLSETSLLNLAAFAISLIIILIVLPAFLTLTGIPVNYNPFLHSWFWGIILMLFFSSVLFSGAYPAIVLTSFRASEALRGRYIHSKRGAFIRKTLVTFQLIMAISLITSTFLVFQQVKFLHRQDKGINVSDVMVVRAPRVRDAAFGSRLLTFKQELLKNNTISKFSLGTEVPGRQILWDAGGIFRVGSDQSKNYQIIGTDYDYLDLLEAKMVAGRYFNPSFSDSSSLVLNEKAVRWMEFESPEKAIDQKVNYWGQIYTIVGVVSNYCQQSPKEASEPHIYRFMPHGRDVRGFFLLRYLPGNEMNVIDNTRILYQQFFPDNPFDHFFLDDYYEEQYRNEKLLGVVFGAFALLAVIITCLGILGLTSFLMLQKTREITMRSVYGSGLFRLISLFSREFIYISVIAFLFSIPLCYYWFTGWLNSFDMKMTLSVWDFILPLALALIFTFSTIALTVRKAASVNPAENLRSE